MRISLIPQWGVFRNLLGARKPKQMRVLLVSSVFPPESVTSASTSYSLAKYLRGKGHDVTVLTSYPSRPGGRIFSGFRRRMFGLDRSFCDLKVVRCFSTNSRTSTLLSRFSENLSFGLFAGLAAICVPRPDVFYVNAWPIFASSIITLIARLRSVPVILSIKDVYPESLVSLGRLPSRSRVSRILRFIDTLAARGAHTLIVVSQRMASIYLTDRGIPESRMRVIPDWNEVAALPAIDLSECYRASAGISQDAFLFLFAGNVAAATGIEAVIPIFASEAGRSRARLLIVGSGGALAACQDRARALNVDAVAFGGEFAAAETSTILRAANVLLLPTLGDQSLVSMPSKLVSYMLSARPILAVARPNSDLAQVIQEAGCGWVVDTDAPEALARQIAAIVGMERLLLMQMGALGREYALRQFASEVCLPKVVDLLEHAANVTPRS